MILILLAWLATAQIDFDFTREPSTGIYIREKTFAVTDRIVEPTPKTVRVVHVVRAPEKVEIRQETPASVTQKAPRTERVREVVYFDFDSARINPAEASKLEPLRGKKGKFTITGYTCDIGTKAYNDRLALRRAEAVRNFLGVDAEVAGRGKCCYVSADRRKNRRAEIEAEILLPSGPQVERRKEGQVFDAISSPTP
ncbi:MAG: OmpA family protein [Candidatus Bathyarchaeia archaeon]